MSNAKKDIENLDDIKKLVDSFYSKVRKDELIGPVFEEKIADRWPSHLEKMYTFWQTVLLDERTYYGSPFPPHAGLNIDNEHFEVWLTLFDETLDEYFEGEIADEARWRAEKMADMFLRKLDYYRNNSSQPLA
ncbi:MAG: group III truncated hemoglobin [Sphingobacteriales bacterium]|jgi:hemoglobin|nr:group III truncated hemoglobin [Sphingobacteriales bacterium]